MPPQSIQSCLPATKEVLRGHLASYSFSFRVRNDIQWFCKLLVHSLMLARLGRAQVGLVLRALLVGSSVAAKDIGVGAAQVSLTAPPALPVATPRK